jgi:hypothetical protein
MCNDVDYQKIIMDTNFWGVLRVLQSALPLLRTSGEENRQPGMHDRMLGGCQHHEDVQVSTRACFSTPPPLLPLSLHPSKCSGSAGHHTCQWVVK